MQKNLLEYLENTSKKFANKPAFCDENGFITFSELVKYAKALGCVIAKKTGAFNRPVAVITDRSVTPIIAFMAALYSGNCYVPIDAKMPKARMDSVMSTLEPCCIVYDKKYEGLVLPYPFKKIEITEDETFDEALLLKIREQVIDLDPAYIIFTSGSTGTPKGIVISHRSVIDFTDWYTETMGINETDVLGNQAPFYFDLSVKDLYTALATGATAHILPQKFFMFPILLMQYIETNKITTLSWATSAFHLVANSKVFEKVVPTTLKRVILGGEALQAKQLNVWRRAMPGVQYVNLYGPTEVTVDCTCFFIEKEFADGEPIPIGKPCINKEIILLSEDRLPVKDGEVGEICVRGSGIALGYYGDRDKTDSAFIQNPKNPCYNDILYCTGDLAYKNADGVFMFMSRRDNQIKHGGYRIELGEVETALSGIDGIRSAICIFDEGRDKIVCIYEGDADADSIAKSMRTLVPKYMLPNIYVKREKMLYTGGGKIDRVQLKEEYYAKNN